MNPVIGRETEQEELLAALNSSVAEFIALYGRRRVGKTYLVRNTFSQRKGVLYFPVTGIKDGLLSEQLQTFIEVVGETFLYAGARLEVPTNWRKAFSILNDNIKASQEKKIVLFF